MKKLLFLTLFVVFISVTALVYDGEYDYVMDGADVLSDYTWQAIFDLNDRIADTGGQVVVCTDEYLPFGYLYADEYANALFNDKGVGDAYVNNGILLYLVTAQGKVWISHGSAFSDDLFEDLLETHFYELFDAGSFDGAVLALLEPFERLFISDVDFL